MASMSATSPCVHVMPVEHLPCRLRLKAEDGSSYQQVAELASSVMAEYSLQGSADNGALMDVLPDTEDSSVLVCKPRSTAGCNVAGEYKVSYVMDMQCPALSYKRCLTITAMPWSSSSMLAACARVESCVRACAYIK